MESSINDRSVSDPMHRILPIFTTNFSEDILVVLKTLTELELCPLHST